MVVPTTLEDTVMVVSSVPKLKGPNGLLVGVTGAANVAKEYVAPVCSV